MTAPADPGFGLYIHWPFCKAKCPYCDFNSHVRDSIDQGRWRSALLSELEYFAAQAAETAPGRRLTSIFFGGGTPSLMDPATAGALIARARELWQVADDLEVTLEANPTSSEAERFSAFAQAGVNRLSIGVQALNDEALAFLGRQHSSKEALAAVDLARAAVPRFSFDLIYARPGQEMKAWRKELAEALDQGPEHIALYQLTIEENTVFHGAWRRGELALPEEESAAALFEYTQDALERAGLAGYEISNHPRPGAECRHNLTYWRYGDYAGVGPGAHGRLTLQGVKTATRQHRAPEAWLRQVEEEGHATRQRIKLSPAERLEEMLMMGLRLSEGIARPAFLRELGEEPEALLAPERLQPLVAGGFLVLDAQGLRATAEGRQRLDPLLSRLLA